MFEDAHPELEEAFRRGLGRAPTADEADAIAGIIDRASRDRVAAIACLIALAGAADLALEGDEPVFVRLHAAALAELLDNTFEFAVQQCAN